MSDFNGKPFVMAELKDLNNKAEMFAAVRNDCEEVNGKNVKKTDGKESLVLSNSGVNVEVKSDQKTKRSLVISLLILGFLALCVAVIVLIVRINDKQNQPIKTCMTRDCVTVAAKLIQGANLSVNPCENFYEFACGGWKANSFLPASKSEWNGFASVREKNANIIKRVLNLKDRTYKNGSAVKKALDFYHSCNDEAYLDLLGAKPLKKLLVDLGSWPILNATWNDTDWQIEHEIVRFHDIFFSYYHHGRPAPIFNSYVKVDDNNSTSNVISIDQPVFTIVPRNYQTNMKHWKEIFGAYEKMVKRYVTLLGGNSSTSDIKDLLDFEMKLANASIPVTIFRDVMKSYKALPLGELTRVTNDKFNWKQYLQKTFQTVNVRISDNTLIGTRSLEYLKTISSLVAATPKRVIANYFGWIVVQKFGMHLSKEFRDAEFKFRKVVLGVDKDTDHWFKCFEVVEDNLDMAIASLFAQAVKPKKAVDVGKQIIEGVKTTFSAGLEGLKWMDTKTKEEAKVKASKMIHDIGYPKFVDEPEKLNQIYNTLSISKGMHLENVVNSYKWRRLKNLNLATEPVNKRLWDLAPTIVNAYYDVSNNKMVFLGGILENPFLDVKGQMSSRFGSFGFVVGHEMTHGFDDQGRLYNSRGNLKDWWSKTSAAAFKTKASCIQRQYSSYKYLNLHVNGNMTLGENIADIGGLKVAYKAFKVWEEANGIEPKLPGLSLNQDQLFFLSFGQLWCGIYNEKRGREIVQSDVHSLPDLRVIGPLSNMAEFSDAFNCPASSRMVRKERCQIW